MQQLGLHLIMLPHISARRNFFGGREARSTKGGLVRGVAGQGVRTQEKLSTFLKIDEKFTCFDNFDRKFAIFQKYLQFFSVFRENSGEIFEKFQNLHL